MLNCFTTKAGQGNRMRDQGIARGRSPVPQLGRSGVSLRCRQALVFMLALMSAACQQFPWALDGGSPRGSNAPRLQREMAMNIRWQNRPLSELVATLGQPVLILTIPGGGNPPGFAVVYGIDPVSGCIDAFALVYGSDPTIRVYYCR
jgi:hypothetical protein